jgi:alkaline phosphatase D
LVRLGNVFCNEIGERFIEAGAIQEVSVDRNLSTIYDRIAFGSCNNPRRPGLWSLINSFSPQKLVLLGDNVYADKEPGESVHKKMMGPQVFKQLYDELKSDTSFQALTAKKEHFMATIDDHDYGQNNADKTFRFRHEAQVHLNIF